MCDVPSWIVDEAGRILYVTDKDARDYCQREGIPVRWCNWTGHMAIHTLYPNAVSCLDHEGCSRCPPEIKRALLDGKMDHICGAADNVPRWPEWMAPVVERMIGSAEVGVRRNVAGYYFLTRAQWARLAGDANHSVRYVVAGNTKSSTVLARLARDPEGPVRTAVVKNPYCASSTLTKLVDDPQWFIRALVAEHTKSPRLLAKLARDARTEVRLEVAENVETPRTVLMTTRFRSVAGFLLISCSSFGLIIQSCSRSDGWNCRCRASQNGQ